jgi:hypothetical protein
VKKVSVENSFTNKNVFNMYEIAVFWRRLRSTSISDYDRADTALSTAQWAVIYAQVVMKVRVQAIFP